MKTPFLLCVVWLLAAELVQAQALEKRNLKSDVVTVKTGITFKFHSDILEEERTIFVALPVGYDDQVKKYPVLYMLDAQWNFNHTAQTMAWLSRCFAATIPNTIVVGIHTGENRFRDLTPTRIKDGPESGKADMFYKFLVKELIPYIEKQYSTYNYRILGGVSLGGLFVINAFTSNPDFFNGYLALSPSMWWDEGVMLKKMGDLLSFNSSINNRLYLALANEGKQMGVDSLAQILKKYSPGELIWKFDTYPEEVHETVDYKGLYDGMKFIFAAWYYPFVDFGIVPEGFPDMKKLCAAIPDETSELYMDSFGRILTFTKSDTGLHFSTDKMPLITLHPDADNRYSVDQTDVQNKLFLENIDIKFTFFNNDSLIVTAGGKLECTAKKINHPPIKKLPDDLERFLGTYSVENQEHDILISIEGHSLKFADGNLIANLYPIGEYRFLAFINRSCIEFEFSKNDSEGETKMCISENGIVVAEARLKVPENARFSNL